MISAGVKTRHSDSSCIGTASDADPTAASCRFRFGSRIAGTSAALAISSAPMVARLRLPPFPPALGFEVLSSASGWVDTASGLFASSSPFWLSVLGAQPAAAQQLMSPGQMQDLLTGLAHHSAALAAVHQVLQLAAHFSHLWPCSLLRHPKNV
jgi:hypothetical protein